MKASLHFLWYDMWIGAFWDRKSRILYLCPLPMVVLKLDFGESPCGCGGPPTPWHDACPIHSPQTTEPDYR